ncbi:MAG: phage tail sheath subtilisin-like domain-containing protein [Oscillospiraceae bacterium]|nr:phage tail sheath subtilisin-like domain-containing protein [Oscillospiraceae bacterium]
MARYLSYGETATRPGNYFNYDKKGAEAISGASDGTTAVLFRADWGPLNKAVVRTADEGYKDVFGTGGSTDVIALTYEGGTRDAVLVRVGTGGTAATVTLKNGGDSPVDAVKLTAKFVGSRAFTVSVRDSISDDTFRECIVYVGTEEFEKTPFTKGGDEVAALVAAFADSVNFAASKVGNASGVMATVTQTAFTAGTDPAVTTADYSAGLSALEQYEQNGVIFDTSDYGVISLATAYVQRMFNAGKNVIAVVGEEKTVDLDTRIQHAAACNASNVVYVLNGCVEHGLYGTIDGYKTAAKIAGMIVGTSCKYSLTHSVLASVTELNELLTEGYINRAEESGCLVLTLNATRQVWIDAAINTLVTLAKNQDAGWKKIRRTRTRFELLSRANNTVDQLVGQVDNDAPGRMAVMDAIRGIGVAMIGEGKIQSMSVSEDPAHPAEGDSAWFIIDVVDKDSAEHLYLRYLFRYSTQV